jgi:glycosyltransferase involved in cell wall biosynthesis
MRISVVVPVFNHQRFLPECLMSLHDQSWDDLELVIIDDASADSSFAVAESFAALPWVRARFSRIAIDRNASNQGAADTINEAIARCTGDLLMIANSDDRYPPQRAAACVEAIRDGFHFVFTGIRCIDEAGRHSYSDEAAAFERTSAEIARFPAVSLALLDRNRAISTGNFCFTRKLFDAIGPFRPLRYCHDWDFILAATLETEPCWIAAPLYEYRLHKTNSFRSLTSVGEEESRASVQRFFHSLDCRRDRNPTLRAMIEAPGLWEKLIRRCGTTVEEEWLAVKNGAAHRPAIVTGGTAARPPASNRGEPSPAASVIAAFQARVSGELFLMGAADEVYADGWIGEFASFRFRVGPGFDCVVANLWVPPQREPCIAIFTAEAGGRPPCESIAVIQPGRINPLSFPVDPMAGVLSLAIRVPDAQPLDVDVRRLGVVISGFSARRDPLPEAVAARAAG